jgi:hypothetical protein
MGKKKKKLKANASDNTRSRMASLISGDNFTGDTLHDIAVDYGYPEILEFRNFWNMYRRFGIADIVITLPVTLSWLYSPAIKSDNESFTKAVDDLISDLKFYQRLKGIDTRQRVGRYAGMFMRVKDGEDPSQPIKGKLAGFSSLVQMVPLYEGQLTVSATDSDPKSDRFSLPTMYQFNGGGVGSRNEDNVSSFQIHYSRIVIAAEGADDGGIYGIPALESCYNSLMDLRKIIGGGAEGFYKNAAQSIVFNLKDTAQATNNKVLLDKFNDKFDEFSRDRTRRALWTPGMDATTLDSSNLASPKEHFFNALYDVSASSMIPTTTLIGQQTGRLASDQDSRSLLSGINSRNNNYVTDMISSHLDWLIKYGILPFAEYTIEWEDLLALSDNEKLENALKMADTNAKQADSGKKAPFMSEEIREAAGFIPEEELEIETDGELSALSASEISKNKSQIVLNLANAVSALLLEGGESLISVKKLLSEAGFSSTTIEEIEEESTLAADGVEPES